MGTAVLSPQDCLTSRQTHQNCHFLSASERPSAATRSRSSGRVSSVPSFPTDCARHGSPGYLLGGCGLLGRKNLSEGLLPLPDQTVCSMQPSFRMSAPNTTSCRVGETIDPFVNRRSSSFLPPSPGSAASGPSLTRYSRVPCLDYETSTWRWFSECSPVLGVQRRSPGGGNQSVVIARLSSNSEQGNCVVGSWSCVAGVASSYQKLVLPDSQGNSTCKVIDAVTRKHGVSRQPKKSASEKVQGGMKMGILQRPSTEEAARKLITSLFEEVTSSHTTNKLISSAPVDSFTDAKVVMGIQRQGSLNVGPRDNCRKKSTSKVGEGSLPHVTISQQLRGAKRDGGVSRYEQCHGGVNIAVETKGVIKDHSTSISGSIALGEYDVPKVHVTSTFEVLDSKVTATNANKSGSVLEMGGISRSLDSVLDSEKWAGPSFFNSPAPSALPVPSFTSKLSRASSTCSLPTHSRDCGVQMGVGNSFPEAKRTWDVTIATMDLRRMLNLDCSSCEL
eukprot:c23013_g1_i3 orf=414-1925(+)